MLAMFKHKIKVMNGFTYNAIFLLLIMLAFSCKNNRRFENERKPYVTLEQAHWLLGKWQNQTDDGILTESWKKLNDSTFYGESYFVIAKDTVFAESIQLAERNEILAYTVTVANQNQAKPVSFILTKINSEKMIFENPAHDFPQKIIYNRIGNDSLVAEISGKSKDKERREIFTFKRKRN